MIIYGIPNCNSMKKARDFLAANGYAYEFHNYKKSAINTEKLQEWVDTVGWEVLVNKRGTTWRNLNPEDKDNLDAAKAIKLMQANTSLIKRPVLEHAQGVLVGFDLAKWEEVLLGSV